MSLHGGAQSSLWPDTVRDNRVDLPRRIERVHMSIASPLMQPSPIGRYRLLCKTHQQALNGTAKTVVNLMASLSSRRT